MDAQEAGWVTRYTRSFFIMTLEVGGGSSPGLLPRGCVACSCVGCVSVSRSHSAGSQQISRCDCGFGEGRVSCVSNHAAADRSHNECCSAAAAAGGGDDNGAWKVLAWLVVEPLFPRLMQTGRAVHPERCPAPVYCQQTLLATRSCFPEGAEDAVTCWGASSRRSASHQRGEEERRLL